ncbi:MAG: SpoVR family protein [Polyangiaceae bacterium]|jgi:stage V sporulation protein R|nr:SpoVR family protein [Polyangiaceae bacterium]
MSKFALNTALPRYLRTLQSEVEQMAKGYGLDFFPTVFEILKYDQMNEIAAYGGFPSRYPHWRFGMEYEQLAKSYEYGLSKIYEMVINNNPSYAYLLEGNSLTEQKLVMSHVLGHVDFFKNNFCFRATDLDAPKPILDPMKRRDRYDPDRRWIDKLANHGSRVGRHVERHGINKVEAFIDQCLSLENLIDPWSPFSGRAPKEDETEDDEPVAVPRMKAKEYMEDFINPREYMESQKKKLETQKTERKYPARPERDVLKFLLDNAPLERWERDVLEVVRDEAYYFVPQKQTKIMNEGWASYWHSRIMTEKLLEASEIIDYADANAGVMATAPGRFNPYKVGVELYRYVEERWNRGQFGKEWEECDDLDERRNWDMKLGLGRKKIFEVRSLYNDVTFIDEFLTPEFVIKQKLYTFGYSGRNDRFEVESRQFKEVKDKLLFQLTNFGDPYIRVIDANYANRGELLLAHEHMGADLRQDYAKETLQALVRVWKRPVALTTKLEQKTVMVRYDGSEHSVTPYRA